MTCVLLAAGHGDRLEEELSWAIHRRYVMQGDPTTSPHSSHSSSSPDLRSYFEHGALGLPKALLPSANSTAPTMAPARNAPSPDSIVDLIQQPRAARAILDDWHDLVRSSPHVHSIVLVSNADKYKHFERWATSRSFPIDKLLNTGSTSSSRNSRGALADLDMALRALHHSQQQQRQQKKQKQQNEVVEEGKAASRGEEAASGSPASRLPSLDLPEPIIVIAADTAIDKSFSLDSLIEYFKRKNSQHGSTRKCDVLTCYEAAALPSHSVGLLTVDPSTREILSFHEGLPKQTKTAGRKVNEDTRHPTLVAAPLYLLTLETAVRIHRFAWQSATLDSCVTEAIGAPLRCGIGSGKSNGDAHGGPTSSGNGGGGGKSIGSYFAASLAAAAAAADDNQTEGPGAPPRVVALRLPASVQLIGARTTSLHDYARYLAPSHARRGTAAAAAASESNAVATDDGVGETRGSTPRPENRHFSLPHHGPQPLRCFCCRSWARVGLMGNPSDQFNGKSVALTVRNFGAEVTCFESEHVHLMAHPLYDPTSFGNLRDLLVVSQQEGYMGGLRLIQATCKRFVEACGELGVVLPDRNFTLRYDTNVPRQVGLAGSSCIVSACLKALLTFFELGPNDIPTEILPSIVLSVEAQELGIHAGLMDRVAQMYEGLVAMDFDKSFLDTHGFGIYERIEPAIAMRVLPPLHLAYAMDPSDSGKIHSNVKERWMNGDPAVQDAARMFACYVDELLTGIRAVSNEMSSPATTTSAAAAAAGVPRDLAEFHELVATLMDMNFDLRRKLYGDACLGWKNLRMIEIARAHGAAAKFPGSGGAILVCCRAGKTDVTALRYAYEAENFVFLQLDPFFGAQGLGS